MTAPVHISSRDNALLAAIRKLQADPGGYRKSGRVWLEGEHLVQSAAARGLVLDPLLVSSTAWSQGRYAGLAASAARTITIDDRLLAQLSSLESATPVGALLTLPAAALPLAGEPTVVLDRVQDAGNVGSVLRTAAAFGWRQVLALKGTAGLWSPKVIRAGMGSHFALRLVEGLDIEAIDALGLPLVATSSHAPLALPQARWPSPCAWVFGHEGQGVSAELIGRCHTTVRIPQPGGEESLNVAAAAAVCLYEDLRRRADQ